jgi:hypothetical protein
MDSVITPFKQWLDKDPEQSITPDKKQHANSIRSAIKQALQQHKGIVLSADEAGTFYDIKILSDDGTVNVVRISNQNSQLIPASSDQTYPSSGASE